jgi:hypothetical protein
MAGRVYRGVDMSDLAMVERYVQRVVREAEKHDRPLGPYELVDSLIAQGYGDDQARSAVSRLVERGKIRFTPERKYRLAD